MCWSDFLILLVVVVVVVVVVKQLPPGPGVDYKSRHSLLCGPPGGFNAIADSQ